ncbi:MAG TPA: hypothetical protein V6C93_02165 [Allocoleopsis sp.]
MLPFYYRTRGLVGAAAIVYPINSEEPKIEFLDDLLRRGCAWLKDYIASRPEDAADICPNRS